MNPFEIKDSPIQGLGAFATQPIPSGTRLIEYAGQRLTSAEADARYPDDADGRHHTYLVLSYKVEIIEMTGLRAAG